jgi:hypothetical protein
MKSLGMKMVNWIDVKSFIETSVSLEKFSVLSAAYRARSLLWEKTLVSRPAENFNIVPRQDHNKFDFGQMEGEKSLVMIADTKLPTGKGNRNLSGCRMERSRQSLFGDEVEIDSYVAVRSGMMFSSLL